jgi:hypothetical protein
VKIETENTTFEAGSTIRLACRIVAGYPPPLLTWYKNNARIPKSTRIVVEEEKTLIINRASLIGRKLLRIPLIISVGSKNLAE